MLAARVTASLFCERVLAAFLSAFATRFSLRVFEAAVFDEFLRTDFSPMVTLPIESRGDPVLVSVRAFSRGGPG